MACATHFDMCPISVECTKARCREVGGFIPVLHETLETASVEPFRQKSHMESAPGGMFGGGLGMTVSASWYLESPSAGSFIAETVLDQFPRVIFSLNSSL
jgi:hypothetical protein